MQYPQTPRPFVRVRFIARQSVRTLSRFLATRQKRRGEGVTKKEDRGEGDPLRPVWGVRRRPDADDETQ